MNHSILEFESIDQIPSELLDDILPRQSNTLNASHFKAIERSRVNDLLPYYIISRQKDAGQGFAHFSIYQINLAHLKKDVPPNLLKAVRTWYPDFMQKKILECGLIAGLGETITTDQTTFKPFIQSLVSRMETIADRSEADIILIRDIPFAKYRQYYTILKEYGYQPLQGYPIATMNLPWKSYEAYYAALKSSTRKNVRKHALKLNSGDLRIQIIQDFDDYTEKMEMLWQQVHDRVEDYEHEILTKMYFKEVNACMKDNSHIIAMTRQGKLIAFALCFVGAEEYFLAHAGIDYRFNQEYDCYFGLYFAGIRDAIERGKKIINFGITAYNFKTMIGAELEPTVYFIKGNANPRITSPLATMLRDSIAIPENTHRPFRNQDISDRMSLKEVDRIIEEDLNPKHRDLFEKARRYSRANVLRFSDIYFYFPVFESTQRPVIQNWGHSVVMLGSNSYMGLGLHPDIREAAKTAIDIYGTGCSGSPILNGTLDAHAELCDALARFYGKESCMLFSTGYMTNLGVISTIAGRHDVIITDTLNHASIMDGTQFSRARMVRYKHGDFESLEAALIENQDNSVLLVVDSVFSMEGTISDLPKIVAMAKKYGARIMVDEAHGVGVLGENGRGAVELFNLIDSVDIIMGTFSKSFAAIGGFIVSDAYVIDYLKHVSRPHLFSASLPPSVIFTIRKALDIIINEPERRNKVLANARFMAEHLQGLGYDAPYQETAIVPVYCRNEFLTAAIFKKLFEEGVYVNPVFYPGVPRGHELLRTSYMATHDEKDLCMALNAFKKIRNPYFP